MIDLPALALGLGSLTDADRLAFALEVADLPLLALDHAPDWGEQSIEVAVAEQSATAAFDTFHNDGTLPDAAGSAFFDPVVGAGARWATARAQVRRLARAVLLGDEVALAQAAPILDRLGLSVEPEASGLTNRA